MNFDFSVIIPCYNAEKFVSTAVRSACQQVGLAVEVIAIDDGSDDDTLRLLRQLEEEFSNLRVISQGENKGQSAARNLGIRDARGCWLGFLDSDDFYKSHTVLAEALANAPDESVDVLYVGALRVTGHRRRFKIPRELDTETIITASVWQLFVRSSYLRREGIQFDERLPQREDKPFCLKVLTGTDSVVIHPQPTIVKVARGGSTMHSTVDTAQIKHRIRHMQNILETVIGNRVSQDIQKELATKYLRTTLSTYWRIPLVENMSAEVTGGEKLARHYLKALHALTRGAVSLSLSNTTLGEGKPSSRFDILRLVAESGQPEYFTKLLRGENLRIRDLRTLVESSQFPWAKSAIVSYLRHFGSSKVDFLKAEAGVPPLSAVTDRVVVHLGYPKTGTSALQEWMEENRFALLEEGIWYPIIGSSRGTGARENRLAGHAGLLRLLGKRATKNRVINSLAAEIASLEKPVHTVVLSSEMFLSPWFWRNPESNKKSHPIRAIRSHIPLEKVDVMVVARPPLTWASKYYKEIISNPFNGYAPTFLRFVRLVKRSKLVDLEILITLLTRVFLGGNVWISSYSDVLKEGGIVNWVVNRIPVHSTGLATSQSLDINTGFTDAQAFILREAKRYKLTSTDREVIFRKVRESEELKNSSYQLVSGTELREAEKILLEEIELFDRHFPASTPLRAQAATGSLEPNFDSFKNKAARKLLGSLWNSHFGVVTLLRDARGLKRLAQSQVTRLLKKAPFYISKNILISIILGWSHRFTNASAHRQIVRRAWSFER